MSVPINEPNAELLRAAILRVLDANDSRFGLDAAAIANLLPAEGFNVPTSRVQTELDLLQDWRFVRIANRPLDRTKFAYVITADGRHQI